MHEYAALIARAFPGLPPDARPNLDPQVDRFVENRDHRRSQERPPVGDPVRLRDLHPHRVVGVVVDQDEAAELEGLDGILVPGGFGVRGVEGKIRAVQYARENDIPFFGICLGMQCAAIEFGRNVVGLEGAHSTEFNKATPHPVVCLLSEQVKIEYVGGSA